MRQRKTTHAGHRMKTRKFVQQTELLGRILQSASQEIVLQCERVALLGVTSAVRTGLYYIYAYSRVDVIVCKRDTLGT
jgi:hypothetical protein